MYTLTLSHPTNGVYFRMNPAPSGSPEMPKNMAASEEIKAKISTLVSQAMDGLKEGPEVAGVVIDMFRYMVARGLQTPESAQKILDGLFAKEAERRESLTGLARFDAINRFTIFIESLSHRIAMIARDVALDNQLNALAQEFNSKIASIRGTYNSLLRATIPR